ncbi:hypothetical protein OG21DRAFT_1423306, partial [Imleria badia]
DSFGIDSNIGTAAVLYKLNCDPKILCYHLGKDNQHTVYEAEAVGLTLAAHLLLTQSNLVLPINTFIDNQAAIKSGDVFLSKSGHYLID